MSTAPLRDSNQGMIASDLTVREFGYRPEMRRTLRFFATFGLSFSFISATTGIFASFGTGVALAGGFIVWAWPIVALGQTLFALVFASLASRVPLAGSSYQWISRMAGPVAGWVQGWMVLVWITVGLLSIDYALAQAVLPVLFGYSSGTGTTWAVAALLLVLQAILIMFSTRWSARVNNGAVAAEIVSMILLSIVIVIVTAIAAHHSFHWHNVITPEPGHHGSYLAIGTFAHSGWWELALLMGIYSLNGFEAAADVAEETANAGRTAPRAIWTSIVVSGIIGFVFLLVLVAVAPALGPLATSSSPLSNIIVYVLGSVVSKIFLAIVAYAIFCCGLSVFLDETRVVFAMSRDNRLPGSRLWKRVHKTYNTPLWATLAVLVLLEVLLAIFARNTNTLFALIGAASIFPPIVYGFPCLIALFKRHKLPASPSWTLGKWEVPVIIASLVWACLVLFILRDHSLWAGWRYAGAGIAIGLIYLGYLKIRGRLTELPRFESMDGDAPADAS